MTRFGILIASFVGLVFALAEGILMPFTVRPTDTTGLSLLVLVLGTIAAGVSGRIILGTRPVHRYFVAAVPILAAISGLAFESGVSNWLIAFLSASGNAQTTLRPAVIVALVIGGVAYLAAATVYGFAGTSQGVGVETRVRLLLLMLLAVIPFLNVLGFIGWVILGYAWKPADATPVPAAVSE